MRIAISIGDPNGIGPEVIMKTFSDNRILDYCVPVIYGSPKVFAHYKKILNLPDFLYTGIKTADLALDRKVNLIHSWEEDFEIKPGEENETGGKFALLSLQAAIDDSLSLIKIYDLRIMIYDLSPNSKIFK